MLVFYGIGIVTTGAALLYARQRRKHEIDLAEALDKAVKAERAKSLFLAKMSHELRTPMNAIIGFAETIQSEIFGPVQNERYKTYADHIVSAGSYLKSIVSDILDASRIDSGKVELRENAIDLRALLDEILSLFEEESYGNRSRILIHMKDDSPKLWGDEVRIKQVFLNLISNSLKFQMDPNLAVVHVEIYTRRNGALKIVVSDNGVGIPADKITHLCDPFFQVADPTIATPSGTGLGLFIVSSLVELHGGTFEIDSEEGKGTKMTMIFPPSRTMTVDETALERPAD